MTILERPSLPGVGKFAAARALYEDLDLASNRWLVARNFTFTLRYYCELFRWRVPSRPSTVSGADELAAAIAHERGLVIVTAHLGHFDRAASSLRLLLGRPVVAVVKPSRGLRRLAYDWARRRNGAEPLAAVSVWQLLARLAAGEVVVVTLDRHALGASLPVTFFGRRVRTSALPQLLARRSGAPFVVATTAARALDFEVISEAPAGASRAAGWRDTQTAVSRIEAAIRRAPQEWHVPRDLEQVVALPQSQHRDGGAATTVVCRAASSL
jgi:lauroyl/myristoyl acyltransferase